MVIRRRRTRDEGSGDHSSLSTLYYYMTSLQFICLYQHGCSLSIHTYISREIKKSHLCVFYHIVQQLRAMVADRSPSVSSFSLLGYLGFCLFCLVLLHWVYIYFSMISSSSTSFLAMLIRGWHVYICIYIFVTCMRALHFFLLPWRWSFLDEIIHLSMYDW